jgi:hypothetical protein
MKKPQVISESVNGYHLGVKADDSVHSLDDLLRHAEKVLEDLKKF